MNARGGPFCQPALMWRCPSWSCSVALLVTAMHGESSDPHAGGITHPKYCLGRLDMQSSYKDNSNLVCICLWCFAISLQAVRAVAIAEAMSLQVVS